MKTAAEEWVGAAHDDLETVKEILGNPRLTHIAAFTCRSVAFGSCHTQQCVEKSFKAVLENHEQDVPNIHNLITLHSRVDEYLPEAAGIDIDMLDRLNQLYIEARYPGEQGLLPEGKPSTEEAQRFFRFAKRVLAMIDERVQDHKRAHDDE